MILLSGLLLAGCRTPENGFVMGSPGGQLECRLWVDEEGQSAYRILSGGRTLVEHGQLGLALKNGRKPFLGGDTAAVPFRVREMKLKNRVGKEDRGAINIRLAEDGGFAAMFVRERNDNQVQED